MHRIESTPSRPEAQGQTNSAETIAFGCRETELGQILLARSAAGVCAILIGSDDDVLANDLQGRFPDSNLVPDAPKVHADLDKVVAFLDAPAGGLDLDLDLQGTEFQQQVWRVLRDVPAGEKLSYTELARRVGAPKAVRAVASACAANAIALAIPCHRVVRSGGALSGYAWGVERKRALLEREARA